MLLNRVAEAMEKRPSNFFTLFVALVFIYACSYSLFDTVQEADFFSKKKYEGRDVEGFYAEKVSNLDAVLVSSTLFLPLPDTLFEFLPGFFSSNTLLVTTLAVLRC
jgi:hypothetical protein